jgi:hypothetical protein
MSALSPEMSAWLAELQGSGSAITLGLTWTQDKGWRCGTMLESGKTLLMSPKQMRKLADRFVAADGRRILGDEMIDNMYAVAAEAKKKNARRELPINLTPAKGSA